MRQEEWDLLTHTTQSDIMLNNHRLYCAKEGIGPDTDGDNGCNCGEESRREEEVKS